MFLCEHQNKIHWPDCFWWFHQIEVVFTWKSCSRVWGEGHSVKIYLIFFMNTNLSAVKFEKCQCGAWHISWCDIRARVSLLLHPALNGSYLLKWSSHLHLTCREPLVDVNILYRIYEYFPFPWSIACVRGTTHHNSGWVSCFPSAPSQQPTNWFNPQNSNGCTAIPAINQTSYLCAPMLCSHTNIHCSFWSCINIQTKNKRNIFVSTARNHNTHSCIVFHVNQVNKNLSTWKWSQNI